MGNHLGYPSHIKKPENRTAFFSMKPFLFKISNLYYRNIYCVFSLLLGKCVGEAYVKL